MTVGQSPHNFALAQSRWTLKGLKASVKGFDTYSLSGIFKVLKSMGIRHLRARQYIHSPDEAYGQKLAYILEVIKNYDPKRQELFFMDQLTMYLHPSCGYDWSAQKQPFAPQGYGSNRTFRICGALHAFSGEVEYIIRSKIRVPTLIGFFESLSQKYQGKTIFIILDNWPVHWHPNIQAALEPQHYPFSRDVSRLWKDFQAEKKYIGRNLPIQLLFLPTYASWLNPIEKVWRWLKQDIIHNHRFTDQFHVLKQTVTNWLDQPTHPAIQLLHYVGLYAQQGIYTQAFQQANSNISKNV